MKRFNSQPNIYEFSGVSGGVSVNQLSTDTMEHVRLRRYIEDCTLKTMRC
jgi:hypothetical protein